MAKGGREPPSQLGCQLRELLRGPPVGAFQFLQKSDRVPQTHTERRPFLKAADRSLSVFAPSRKRGAQFDKTDAKASAKSPAVSRACEDVRLPSFSMAFSRPRSRLSISPTSDRV